ncbi:protein FAM227A [Lacerta agilis]|uniref:protein FAM227A n=1 Tax=Lacerta agilis TaxID=80427 RepID=UPI00141A078A|nr:protein FAM227A [Lacerta agilis]
MQFVTIKSFVSPLKGFLILPSATQEKKSDTISCELDDKPRLYVIGSIGQVNQKISHLELGLKRYDSSEDVSKEILSALDTRNPTVFFLMLLLNNGCLVKVPEECSGFNRNSVLKELHDRPCRKLVPNHPFPLFFSLKVIGQMGLKRRKASRKVSRAVRAKERDQKVMQKSGKHATEKIAQKKMVTEKDKLVELYQYPGYCKEKPTPLPNGIELSEILGKVIRAQGKTPVGKTRWAAKMLQKFLDAPCIQAILLDSFWWQFLHLYHPNQEIQGLLFERISENYSRVLFGCHKVANQEHILTLFPSLLSQAVYTCFCYCFSRSWFNTHEFKAGLCDVFSEWLRGSLNAPGSYTKWDYSQLEPERSRREDLLSGKGKLGTGCDISFINYALPGTTRKHPSKSQKVKGYFICKHQYRGRSCKHGSIKKVKKSVSRKKIKKEFPLEEETAYITTEKLFLPPQPLEKMNLYFQSLRTTEDDEQNLSYKHQRPLKKKLKIALLPRESHPASSGPDYTWHHLNIHGHCPLIQHFLQKRNAVSKAGCDIFLSRRAICKPIPDSAQTYAEVIKQSFKSLRQRHKDFMKTYRRQRREMRKFDQMCKYNLLIFRQEMLEEMKRQAQKQKELFSCPEALSSSDKFMCRTPKVTFN